MEWDKQCKSKKYGVLEDEIVNTLVEGDIDAVKCYYDGMEDIYYFEVSPLHNSWTFEYH